MSFFKNKNKAKLRSNMNQKLIDIGQEDFPVIVEDFPLNFKIDHNNLYEIKDTSVIAQLNGIVQGGTQRIFQDAQKNGVQKVVKEAGTLLKSDIPLDKLTNAKGVEGGYRGIQRGKITIKRQAVLTEFDSSKIARSGKVAVGFAKVMNVSSLIVGQYYMSEVSTKLDNINKNINSIGNYQQREFKSRILALINNIEEISKFSSEILGNSELRERELHQLSGYKNEAVQLLEQVNITIREITNEYIVKFKEYQFKVDELEKLLEYQKILSAILNEISKLVYTLNLGGVSIEKCYSSFNNLLSHSNESRKLLPDWHQFNLRQLGIDLDYNRLKKRGVEGIVVKPLSIIDEKWDYKELKSNLKSKIIHQSKNDEVIMSAPQEFFNEDVELIIKDGKYYYYTS